MNSDAANYRMRRVGCTLKLFLVDGSSTGVITAELGNWSGKALVAPRTALPDLIKREEASRTGVYLLMGQRRQLVEDGVLVKTPDGQHYNFARDVAFSSPSGAAAVVYGGNISGPATWRREGDGLSYKDWRQQQFAQAQGGEE